MVDRPTRLEVCGAVDRITGAVCTQTVDHPAVPDALRHSRTGAVEVAWRFAGQHVDLTDRDCPVGWPDDEHTLHREAAS